MIGLLLSFLGILASPFGMLFFLLGVVQFISLPMISRVTNYFHAFSRLHLWLGARMLKRACVVVSEHGDLLLKRMSPDDIGTETIQFNSDTKEFEDQNERRAKSNWMGIPFALADEVHGFLFTPKDAALGKRKLEAEQDDEMVVKATAQERQMYDVQGWVRGVLEFPKGQYELTDLNYVRQLVTGSERSEHPQRVKSFYELSREPYNDGPSTTKFIAIIIALIGPFAAIWVLSSQLGLNTSGATDSVSFGLAVLLSSLTPAKNFIENIDWKRVVVSIVVLGALPALFVGVLLLMSPFYAIALFVIMGMGFWSGPILIEVLKLSDKVTDSLSNILLKSGLSGYEEPVFEYTNSGYEVREFNKLNVDKDSIVWHSFLGRKFGFTFTPEPSNWDIDIPDIDDLDNRAVADGGAKTNLPSGYQVIPERTRAAYGDFLPRRLDKSKYYPKTGIALSRMKNVSTGGKSHGRLTQSKEEYGGNSGISEQSMMYMVVGCGMFSFLAGIGVFILPALL